LAARVPAQPECSGTYIQAFALAVGIFVAASIGELRFKVGFTD
jgi:hypothetical protein